MTLPTSSGDYAVETRGLVKRFGRTVALAGIDLAIPTGCVFGVIGPNGAGKTTLMRLLLDIIRPTSGEIRVLGVAPRAGGSDLRSRIGFLPGELHLQSGLTARRLLDDFASISGPVEPGRIDELAATLGLDLDERVRRLSKGNKQKLSLIQAFMHRPRLLVLDEPTSGLDPLVQQQFQAMAREATANGQTIFLSSHVLSEVQDAADSVAILRQGSVVKTATVAELRESAVRHARIVTVGLSETEVAQRVAGIPGVGRLDTRRLPTGAVTGAVTGARTGARTGAVTGPETGAGTRAETGPVIECRATLSGAAGPFVAAVAGLPLQDLVIEEPNLEEAVLTLYAESDTEPPTQPPIEPPPSDRAGHV